MVRKKILPTPPSSVLVERRIVSIFSKRRARREGKKLGQGTFLPFPFLARCLSRLENGDQASLVKQSNLASILLFPVWLRSKDSSFPSAKTTGPCPSFFAKYDRTNETRSDEGEKGNVIRRGTKERSGDE